MDIADYLIYLVLPIALSGMYWYAEKNKRVKTVLRYNILKGIVYFYLAIALVFTKSTEKYITALTLYIAIIEGNSAICSAVYGYKRSIKSKDIL